MKSLWAGVSGLQAHQIAMDVEGNNIANVNTAGFKYSRANFSDLLSQTAKIATAPQGTLGGKNPTQIGLGAQVSNVTKIFKQGSIETTDKNTDLAIQGDGFFVVSPDGGSTYKYTRNGDFTFDAEGNFTDSNGYIIQGWVKDSDTGEIDATTPISDITIAPGLTTPANDSSFITLKANLNSGDSIVNKSAIYSLDSYEGWYDSSSDGIMSAAEKHDENDSGNNQFNSNKELIERGMDMASLFDSNGDALKLQDSEGIWVSYQTARTEAMTIDVQAGEDLSFNFSLNGVTIDDSGSNYTAPQAINGVSQQDVDNTVTSYIAQLINQNSTLTGVTAKVESGNKLTLINENQDTTESSMKNISFTNNSTYGTSSSIGIKNAKHYYCL